MLKNAEGHQFDEADGHLMLGGESRQRPKLLFVESAKEDAVEFYGPETGLKDGPEAFQKLLEESSGDLPVKIRLEGVETEVDRLDARLPKGLGQRGDASAVRGEGEGLQVRERGEAVGDFQ